MHLRFGTTPTKYGTGRSGVAAASLVLHILLAGGATAADLPLRHRTPAHHHVIIRRVVVAPSVVVVDTTVLTPPPRTCAPGYSESAAGPCLRHGELRIACGRDGRDCVPLPPDPMPYGLGPYLRPDY